MRDSQGRFKLGERNPVEYHEGYAVIWATDRNGNKKAPYKVDIEDVERLLEHRWSVATDGYAKHRTFKMHRVIMNAEKGQIIDHINQDKSDNRKENLRFATHSVNMRNREMKIGLSGVRHITKFATTYAVSVRCKGKRYYEGGFENIEEAIERRNEIYEEINYFER